RVAPQVGAVEETPEHGAQDDRQQQRAQERPADSQDRAAVAGAQVNLHERQPEVAAAPDPCEIVYHRGNPFPGSVGGRWVGILSRDDKPGQGVLTGWFARTASWADTRSFPAA